MTITLTCSTVNYLENNSNYQGSNLPNFTKKLIDIENVFF